MFERTKEVAASVLRDKRPRERKLHRIRKIFKKRAEELNHQVKQKKDTGNEKEDGRDGDK